MRHLLFLLFITGGICNIAHSTGPSLKKLDISGGKTWAVVIGISDYQDKDIPNLSYAHRDAEAFALWLQSPAGGGLEGDQLQVLINDKATAGRVAEAFDALIEHVQENDNVFIYFSGHGDVERKTVSQPGFLLCWDAPSRVYMGGGTYSLTYLQEIIVTLSLHNNAKVTVIADACRAGKLAGSQVGGPQLTSSNLLRQQANEIKILSCQPEEYSLEGAQWGGGRGVFSYHLMNGLYGLADHNGDGVVTLGELDRYLEDHVTAQAAPISQVPVLLGNKTDEIAIVHEETLVNLSRIKYGEIAGFTATDSRGLEDEVLSTLDTGIVKLYIAFKEAVVEKRFFPDAMNENSKPTADELYTLLIAEPGLSPLYGAITRNYAAALQDDAQQELNFMLKTGLNKEVLFGRYAFNFYKDYPAHLERASELLEPEHYMYADLKARQLFFAGKMKEKSEESREAFNQALEWQPNLPHVWFELGKTYPYNADSRVLHFNKAIELAPTWITPYLELARIYQYSNFKQFDSLIDKAGQIDSNSLVIWYLKAGFYAYDRRNFEKAEMYYLKVIEGSKTSEIYFPCAHFNLANLYLNQNRFTDALREYKTASELNATFCHNNNNINDLSLPLLYNTSWLFEENLELYKTIVSLDSTNAAVNTDLWFLYLKNGRNEEAERQMEKLQLMKVDNPVVNFRIGKYFYLLGDERMAKFHFEEYIKWNKNFRAAQVVGWFYTNHGEFEQARHYFEQVIAVREKEELDFYNIYYDLAWLYFSFGKRQEAIQVLSSLTEDRGIKNQECMGHLLMFRSFEEEPNKAKAYFESFVQVYPNIMTVWECIELMKTNQYDKAEAAYLSITEGLHEWWIYKFVRIHYVHMKIRQGKYQDATSIMDNNGMGDYPYPFVTIDSGFAPLWNMDVFMNLMNKFYPEKAKK